MAFSKVYHTRGHLASRSDRHGAPVLICPVRRPQTVLIQTSKRFAWYRRTHLQHFAAFVRKWRSMWEAPAYNQISNERVLNTKDCMPTESRGTASTQGSWFLPLDTFGCQSPNSNCSYPFVSHIFPHYSRSFWTSAFNPVLGFTRSMRDHDTPSSVLRHCCSLWFKRSDVKLPGWVSRLRHLVDTRGIPT